MICEGDYVKIRDDGFIYSTCPEFYIDNCIRDRLCKYAYGVSPTEEEIRTSIFKVIKVSDKEDICVITNGIRDYLIGSDGLKKVTVIENCDNLIKEGDKVRITDEGLIYSEYGEFMIRHKKDISDKHFWNFRVGLAPNNLENNPSYYKVEFVDFHPDNLEIKLAVICSEDNTFIIDVDGLKKVA